MARPRVHDDAVRHRLLEVASEVIARHGAEGLSLRDVARRAGTSTTAVYTLFGGRDELVAEVGTEAFRRFAGRLAAAPRSGDPRADLLALGLAYRAGALDEPHFYRVMFDVAGAGARAAAGPPVEEHGTFRVLRDRVRDVVGPDVPEPAVVATAHVLWALVHGLVQLELGGLTPGDATEREARYARALATSGAAVVAAAVSDPGGTLAQ